LRNFDYYNSAIEIKSNIYQEAIKLMKRDLKSDTQSKRESNLDESDERVERLVKDDLKDD
jgi:hypothetical protein